MHFEITYPQKTIKQSILNSSKENQKNVKSKIKAKQKSFTTTGNLIG